MADLPEPINVSPLIRFARWSLLLGGIFYGYSRQKYLAHREVHLREVEEKRRAIRDAKIREERRIASERDVESLSRIFTGPSSSSSSKSSSSKSHRDVDEGGTCGPK